MPKRESTVAHAQQDAPRILHVLPTFGVGGVQDRTVTIINELGGEFWHRIIALNGDRSCERRLSGKSPVEFHAVPTRNRQAFRSIISARAQLRRLRPDLLLTYNWGTIEWAFANGLSPISPHIHIEDGFGLEEADRQLARRVLFRRMALRGAYRLVVPSKTLAKIATEIWRLDADKVVRIPNGIDCARGLVSIESGDGCRRKFKGSELVIGTVAPLRPEKNLEFLLAAFKAISHRVNATLLIAGDGPERGKLERKASVLGIADRVAFPGHIEAVEEVLAGIDIFALTSRTEQMPFSVLQAMAAAKPVAAVDVGDVKSMLPTEARAFVIPRNDEAAFSAALERLLSSAMLREEIGRQNRLHVMEHFPLQGMVAAYRMLFHDVVKPRGGRAPAAG